MTQLNVHDYMTLALQLAQKGEGFVSPNPMVGCVIVKDRQIIGQGFHESYGQAHAEINALAQAGKRAVNADMYITLEPCGHYGKTPPCVDAIIAAKIKRIFIADIDPNPLMQGKSIAQLRAANIDVQIGLLQKEAAQLNEVFYHFIKTGRPFLIAKWAMSLDGKTITHSQDSRIISDKTSQQHSHLLRKKCDAILIGANTAIKDDPKLTIRLANNYSRQQPWRIILARNGSLPLHLKMFNDQFSEKTLVFVGEDCNEENYQQLCNYNIKVQRLPVNKLQHIDLKFLLIHLTKMNISSVLIEGGQTIQQSFFNENLINKVHVYIAPVIIGNHCPKSKTTDFEFSLLKNDLHIVSYLEENSNV